jgi:2'-5' RNA ligase
LARCHDVPGGELGKFLKSNAELDAGMFRVEAFHLYCSELTPAGPIHTCQLSMPAR